MDGTYPTSSVCELCGCKGCLPAEAYDEQNRLKPRWKDVKPGHWTTSLPDSAVALPMQRDTPTQEDTPVQRDTPVPQAAFAQQMKGAVL